MEFVAKSRKGIYGDACQELDWSVGQVMDKLKQLGLDEDTIVVYTSDNGGPSYRNGYPTYKESTTVFQSHPASNVPLRGFKGTPWEGGSRVPCIVRWPGKIPPRRISNEMAGMVDFLPTFAHLTGVKVPEDRPIDGINLWPLLHGDMELSQRQVHVYYGIWNARETALRVGAWKLVNGKQLFNLQTDLSEAKNAAGKHPVILKQLQAYQAQVIACMKADKPLPVAPNLNTERQSEP